jgi:galactokinase/mevalonate kinase-like predicted kinase
MKYLLSLPEQAAPQLRTFKAVDNNWQAFSDPPDSRLGSGGGTAWLLYQSKTSEDLDISFETWLAKDQRILIHAGGLSRRLPSYSAVGKSMIPVPVYRWARGQQIDQTLIDLQLPLAQKILQTAPSILHTLILSGDALVTAANFDFSIPEADVVLFAVSTDPSVAMNHGVFVCDPEEPGHLKRMLQKPSREVLQQVAMENLFFIDTGMWLLSDKAVNLVMEKSGWNTMSQKFELGIPNFHDLYGTFGACLGSSPHVVDSELNELSVAVVPIQDGEFHHFGTSREIILSSLALQNKVLDQRLIWARNIKPHPSIFTQNAIIECKLEDTLQYCWIENAHIPETWTLHGNQVITGIPENRWTVDIPERICLDFVPLGKELWVIRPYGIDDPFRGSVSSEETVWMNRPVHRWFEERNLQLPSEHTDIQDFSLFPVLSRKEISGGFIQWMISSSDNEQYRELYERCTKFSASGLLMNTDLGLLSHQRTSFRRKNYLHLGKNYRRSVFYQIDLRHAAQEMDTSLLETIPRPDSTETPLLAMHDSMLRSLVFNDKTYEKEAFSILQEHILSPVRKRKVLPSCNVYPDQIVWSRSPVRIDLAGGWTDTPPHSLLNGGDVVTVALELNGQPPLQAYIRPITERRITLRSIDQGSELTVSDFGDLLVHNDLGSGFSIPKAALCLTGFHPDFCSIPYSSLAKQLDDIGSGFELTFFSAVPRGSGMGTSSVLSATILGALSDFCGLGWDLYEIGDRSLALEQLLTSGGGWQDQYGGIFPGIKHLHTERGINQRPNVKWLPGSLFTDAEYKDCMVLYYTGITRVAKNLLGEIVKGMFLNDANDALILDEMKHHAYHTAEVIQQHDFQGFGHAIARTWDLKNRLDKDTNNAGIQQIIDMIDEYAAGYVLPGAGGGGFLFIIGKDVSSTNTIRSILRENRTRPNARIVDLKLSTDGMKVTRS